MKGDSAVDKENVYVQFQNSMLFLEINILSIFLTEGKKKEHSPFK